MASTALNIFHKVLATGLIGTTAFGFYVFGDMGYGIVQRRNERERLKALENQNTQVNLDELPVPNEKDQN